MKRTFLWLGTCACFILAGLCFGKPEQGFYIVAGLLLANLAMFVLVCSATKVRKP